jgi:hypothetical protein
LFAGRPDIAVDVEGRRLSRRYVLADRRYMYLVAGNFLGLSEASRAAFGARLSRDGREVPTRELQILLESEDWRDHLTGAWLAAVGMRTETRPMIVHSLSYRSEIATVGQGSSVALARFGTPQDAEILERHLDCSLAVFANEPESVRFAAQGWAIGALMYLDDRLGTSHAMRFLVPDGPWDQWSRLARVGTDHFHPVAERQQMRRLCEFLERCADAA